MTIYFRNQIKSSSLLDVLFTDENVLFSSPFRVTKAEHSEHRWIFASIEFSWAAVAMENSAISISYSDVYLCRIIQLAHNGFNSGHSWSSCPPKFDISSFGPVLLWPLDSFLFFLAD